MISDEDLLIIVEFKKVVNMSAKILDAWLKTGESKEVGFKENEGNESIGQQSGRQIVELLTKKQDDYTADDFKHAQKVSGSIHRHLAHKPEGDAAEINWRYSLMNWGHDPENK